MLTNLFILASSIIYIIFNVFEFSNLPNTTIKYFGILLCYLYCLISFIKNKSRKTGFLLIGSTLTVIADYFLLVIDNYYFIGVACFCVVQTIYSFIVFDKKSYLFRIVLFLMAASALIFIFKEKDISAILAMYSIINLTTNMICGFVKKDYCLAIAFLLFTICDLTVGICNLSSYIILKSSTRLFIRKLYPIQWLTYYPSQVILALSGGKNEK